MSKGIGPLHEKSCPRKMFCPLLKMSTAVPPKKRSVVYLVKRLSSETDLFDLSLKYVRAFLTMLARFERCCCFSCSEPTDSSPETRSSSMTSSVRGDVGSIFDAVIASSGICVSVILEIAFVVSSAAVDAIG